MKICAPIVFMILLLNNSVLLEAETIWAKLVSMSPSSPKVGNTIVGHYEIVLNQSNRLIHLSDIRYTSTDNIHIKKVDVETTGVVNQEGTEQILHNLHVIMAITSPGVHYLPHFQIKDMVIQFPPINVISVLDIYDLKPRDIPMYVPGVEIRNILIFYVLLMMVLYCFIQIIIVGVKRSHIYIDHIKNLYNIFSCMRQIDKMIVRLKHIGGRKNKKSLMTFECYSKLLVIIQSRLSCFHSLNFLLSLTNDELKQLLLSHIDIAKLQVEEIEDFFLTLNQVFYDHQTYTVETRVEHCKLVKKIIWSSMDIPVYMNTAQKNNVSLEEKEAFNVFQ